MTKPAAVDCAIENELTWLQRRLEAVRRPTAPGEPQSMDRAAYLLLGELAHGPRSTASLAQDLHLDQSTVIRQVAALQRQGWVRKAIDPAGGRAAVLEVTADGRRQATAVRAGRASRVSVLLSDWDEHDRNELARLLGRLNSALDDTLRANGPQR